MVVLGAVTPASRADPLRSFLALTAKMLDVPYVLTKSLEGFIGRLARIPS
jgi:hypothetical protein